MNLTHQDHLKWWLQDPTTKERVLYKPREHLFENFVVEYGKPSRAIDTWYDELRSALKCLIDTHGSRVAVFYSGGFDSEILVRTLKEIGAKVEPHTIRFIDGENADEVDNTYSVCESLGLKQIVWEHDVVRYVKEERYLDLGLKYQCTQLAYITVLEYVRKLDLPTIMGGEIYVQKRPKATLSASPDYEWNTVYREDEDGMTYRYSYATGHPLINEVFSYTPELVEAWLTCNTVQDIVTGRIPGKLSLLSSKKRIFDELYPYNLTAQRKLHGYENLFYTHLVARNHLKSLLPSGQHALMPVPIVEVPNGNKNFKVS